MKFDAEATKKHGHSVYEIKSMKSGEKTEQKKSQKKLHRDEVSDELKENDNFMRDE